LFYFVHGTITAVTINVTVGLAVIGGGYFLFGIGLYHRDPEEGEQPDKEQGR
jgi:hypothetical protein